MMITMRNGLLLLGIILLVGLCFVAVRQLGLVAGEWGGTGTESLELVLQADGADSGRPRADMDMALDEARAVIADRVDALGAREASVSRQGANRILVRVAGIRDAAAARVVIIVPGRFELRLVDLDVSPQDVASGLVPAGSRVLRESGDSARIPVERRVVVTGGMITDARQTFDASGNPVVTIALTDDGARRLARVTSENVGKPLAFILDDAVLSTPVINEPITGGIAQISGAFTVESANDLAILINTGAIPIKLRVVGEKATTRTHRD